MSTINYEGILSHVDKNGNVHQLLPFVRTDKKLTESGIAADAAVVGEKLKDINTSLTITRGVLYAGETNITIQDDRITGNSILTFFTSIYGVNPTAVSTSVGTVTLTFNAQDIDMEVGVRVDG